MSVDDCKKPAKFSAETYGKKMEITIDHSDLDISELMDVFYTITIGMGFTVNTWKLAILDMADEYGELSEI
jgi:hypothetical protein